jgi:uncharacterized protein (DUF983 family)
MTSESSARMPTLIAIMRQMCPRCRSAKIFRKSIFAGFPRMFDSCSACGLKFNREPGYFLGAMYASYGIALAVITAFGLLLWAMTDWSLVKVCVWAMILFLPFAPSIALFSRVLWIYLDQSIDPERPAS